MNAEAINIQLQKIITDTTVVKIERYNYDEIIFGPDYYISEYQKATNIPANLDEIEKVWNDKFSHAKTKEERFNYRNLYESFKMFYLSFEQLRLNKIAGIYSRQENSKEFFRLNELAGVNLFGIYHHGKKCIDLIKNLGLQQKNDIELFTRFSGTRNKFIEHNFNPKGYTIRFEPEIWSLASTDSALDCYIHTTDESRSYSCIIDYYADYFSLESRLVDIIKAL